MSQQAPQLGQVVHCRSRKYLVECVTPPPEVGHLTTVALSCLDDDAQGQRLEVLWEREVDKRIEGGDAWKSVAKRGFDDPKLFSAFLHAQRWSCVTSTNAKLFQAPYRAGIDVKPYQLEPLRKALALPRVNLFIADDVGLGKTIEAGLILRELLMRQKVKRVVVACPPSVVLQWRDELDARFGLTFEVFDRAYVARRRRERGFGANPWHSHTRFILSHALLRDEEYAAPLRDWLGDFSAGSMLILDEAHHAAPASGAVYAVDSNLTRVVRDVAKRFEHKLFLSATPHNGHSNSFSALLEILDPQRFVRGTPVTGKGLLDAIMVRRLKSDLRKALPGAGFADRQPIQIDISGLPAADPELVLPALLDEYRHKREARLAKAPKGAQRAAALVLTSLQKRLLSSVEAFASTLAVHRRTLERHARARAEEPEHIDVLDATRLDGAAGADDRDEDRDEDDVEKDAQQENEAASARAALDVGDDERKLLAQMTEIAESARHAPDARIKELLAWMRGNMCPSLPVPGKHAAVPGKARWNDRRVILFTEYTDTKRYIVEQLQGAVLALDDSHAERRIRTFHGGLSDESREELKRAFNADPRDNALRILVCTDAAREGVNLQNHCADLFHLDVPWNPSRIEQRNGRIDRTLQRSPIVRCHYFVYSQRPEDQVLRALVQKTETIRAELGSLSPILEERLARGIRRDATGDLVAAIAEASSPGTKVREEELEVLSPRQAALAKQVSELEAVLEDSQRALGLSVERFRDALSCSLRILGSPSLAAVKGDLAEMFTFPKLDDKDASWAETLDTLRPPRPKGVTRAEWRREAPIRPVIFRDSGTLDDKAVHLHLDHRVVQRLLSRFAAQGFVHDDLSRACILAPDSPVKRVVLLGRLSLYGAGASRLHDEVIAVTAQWTDPRTRGAGGLKPYKDATQNVTLDLLEKSLGDARPRELPKDAEKVLRTSAVQDVKELLPHLEERADAARAQAKALLEARGKKEALEMRAILEAQQLRIEETQRSPQKRQLEMAFQELSDRERRAAERQLEQEKQWWRVRLDALVHELVDEPKRVEAAYSVAVSRIEPIGLIYLWPRS